MCRSSDLDQNVCNRQPGKDQLQLRPNNQSSANDDEQRFVKPDQPCDNCRAKQYECYMTFGKVICKACHSLSKPCSFVHGGTSQDISPPALDEHLYLDAMDAISDASPPRGTFNKAQSPTPTSTAELDNSKKTATATRFSRTAVKILRDWLDAHVNNPYPNDHEKIELEQRTGLRTSQISTWLANARRRSKVGKSHKRSQSPSIPGARDIPGAHAARNMTPWNEVRMSRYSKYRFKVLMMVSLILLNVGSTRLQRTSQLLCTLSPTPSLIMTCLELVQPPIHPLGIKATVLAVHLTPYRERNRCLQWRPQTRPFPDRLHRPRSGLVPKTLSVHSAHSVEDSMARETVDVDVGWFRRHQTTHQTRVKGESSNVPSAATLS